MGEWSLALSLAFGVVMHGVLAVRLRRLARDRERCAPCGYALNGLPGGAPCPECGASPSPGPRPSHPP